MKHLLISKFKAHCIAELNDVCRTGEPLIVTRRGLPLVKIEALQAPSKKRQLGTLEDQTLIQGNLLPGDFAADWEMER